MTSKCSYRFLSEFYSWTIQFLLEGWIWDGKNEGKLYFLTVQNEWKRCFLPFLPAGNSLAVKGSSKLAENLLRTVAWRWRNVAQSLEERFRVKYFELCEKSSSTTFPESIAGWSGSKFSFFARRFGVRTCLTRFKPRSSPMMTFLALPGVDGWESLEK